MKLDELIDRTHANLSGTRRRVPIKASAVRQVLEDAEINNFFDQESVTKSAARLMVRRVRFRGSKWQKDEIAILFEYDRHLHSGTNVWVAGNSRGKSTILKVIVWALTGVKPTMKQDVEKWLEEASVEIEIIDEGIYTIQYFLRPDKAKVNGFILPMSIDDMDTLPPESLSLESKYDFAGIEAMKEKIGEFLGTRFGFHSLSWLELKRYSINLTSRTISWDVYSQAIFLGADDYSDYLFSDFSNRAYHQRTLSLYLGMELIKAVAELERLFREAQQEYQLERRRIEADAKGVQEKLERLQQELDNIEVRLEAIDAEQAAIVDVTYANRIQEQVSRLTEQKAETALNLESLQMEERHLQRERNLARRQAQEMKEAIQFRLYLSGLEVERCPLCETDIPVGHVETDLDEASCRVCHKPLQPLTDTTLQEKFLKEAESKATELEREQKRIKKSIRLTEDDLGKITQELEEFTDEFRSLSQQQRAGFTVELRSLLNRRGYILGQIDELQQRTPKSQEGYLQQLKEKSDVLQKAKGLLGVEMTNRSNDVLRFLQERVTQLALEFRVRNIQEVYLQNFELFIRQSETSVRFPDLDIGERLRLKLAFHLALLTLRMEENVGRHPGVLIIDAPGGAEITDATFETILNGISDLSTRFGDRVQILIASTRDELLQAFPPDRVEHKSKGAPLF